MKWNPFENEKSTSDPYKTLFISNINYETSEKKVKREFDQYGEIKRIRLIKDTEGKPRGYGFIEYEHKKDMVNAYKNTESIKIDGRRLIVDIERGRTFLNFTPRKFGGGIGKTRKNRYSESRSRSRDRKKKSKKDKKRKKSRSKSYSRSRSEEKKKKKKRNYSPSEERERERERKSKKEKREKSSVSPAEKKSKKDKEKDKDRSSK